MTAPYARVFSALLTTLFYIVLMDHAQAAGTGMPWESPLEQIADSISGPVAKTLGGLSIIGLGLGAAASEGGSMTRKALSAGFGLAVAFTAFSFFVPLFGFAGGATF